MTKALKPLTGDDWAELILGQRLSDPVPEKVRRLFAVAQGALVYGYFYYPLFALGTEQLARVGETAIRHKCLTHGIPVTTERWDRSLRALLQDLSKAHLLTDDEKELWGSL